VDPSGKGVEITNELRNNTYFETVKHKGFSKYSIGGLLTGDPTILNVSNESKPKDRKQANLKNVSRHIVDYTTTYTTIIHPTRCCLQGGTKTIWPDDFIQLKSEFYNK
jgi:hypothetical protein